MLVQKAKNILPPRQPVEAALSHTSAQHVKEFLATDHAGFDHARDHRQIRQHGRVHQGYFVKREALQSQLHDLAECFLDSNLRWLMREI